VPTTIVVTEPFMCPAEDQAQGQGVPGLPLVVVPHPMAALGPTDVAARADAVFDAICRVLASDPPAVAPVETSPVASGGQLTLRGSFSRVLEECWGRGWTDGLPVVPPTRQLVDAMLSRAASARARTLGPVPPRMRPATLEVVAANAVMAGCAPEHFPVVVAALRAVLDPAAGLYSSQTATNTSAPLLVVNGPMARRLDINAGPNCFGPGWRANTTIGRAVRLVLRNVGGEIPGVTDPATHGQPGKITYCLAENEEHSPWEPWHVTHGFAADQSTVTAVMASPPQNIFAYGCNTAHDLLDHVIGALTGLGHNNVLFATGPVLVFGPEHAELLARGGYDRRAVQEVVFDRARIPLDRFPEPARVGIRSRRARWFELVGDTRHIGVADRPDDVHLLVAGGPGIHAQFISTAFSVRPVIEPIEAWGYPEASRGARRHQPGTRSPAARAPRRRARSMMGAKASTPNHASAEPSQSPSDVAIAAGE
jgi:hypothetical protein